MYEYKYRPYRYLYNTVQYSYGVLRTVSVSTRTYCTVSTLTSPTVRRQDPIFVMTDRRTIQTVRHTDRRPPRLRREANESSSEIKRERRESSSVVVEVVVLSQSVRDRADRMRRKRYVPVLLPTWYRYWYPRLAYRTVGLPVLVPR
jgi:hypothetical protein